MITEEVYQKAKWIVAEYERLRRIEEEEARKKEVAECDHHYIPTNSKWQSATQVRCCFCGDVQG